MMDWSTSERDCPESAADAPACASMASILNAICSLRVRCSTLTVSNGFR